MGWSIEEGRKGKKKGRERRGKEKKREREKLGFPHSLWALGVPFSQLELSCLDPGLLSWCVDFRPLLRVRRYMAQ